ncbi:hydroxymethylglutaryl-CoA synthase [Weissella viridescens]|uniref:Hydroxymethylglutaryl-CoA synthase n=1 Tax=Weissella viridescens TaxID=1629 RepID=A0A0R2H8H3_WEIVI|nr:hydroxymethylglutaryl-CoA synthase [Weissella viridescens]KRN46154.1 hydroxymethylglutaryl-CoA synthase [Weissella viridescens]GEA95443.1 hydroxymethylglutaryl-CoA synthase [Weissella viridescens]
MEVGIDKMSFFSTQYYIDMVDLAHARGEAPDKYLIGIGQTQQAVAPATQDVVTMGANAADQMLTQADRAEIEEVIFATESGVDQSKSAAVYVQKLLGINRYARTIELKQACYSGTYGLMQARDYVTLHPKAKVLVIASDIARYGINTGGEVTQGAGAVAMLVTANPTIATLNQDNVFMSDEIMDFWRPNDSSTAVVDGKFSANIYRDFFKEVWERYQSQTGRDLNSFKALVFHLPFTKMGLKALRDVLPEVAEQKQHALMDSFEASRRYNKQIGNLYTGSAYLSLMSLLLNDDTLAAGDELGLFSYGSGAEGEMYSLTLQPEYNQGLIKEQLPNLLAQRTQLSIAEYEKMFDSVVLGSADRELDITHDHAKFVLGGVKDQKRQYVEQF